MRIVLILLLFAALTGCQSSDQQSQADQPQTETTEPTELTEETVLARNAAEQLVMRFQERLKGELMAAISEHDPAGAIGVCQTIAPAIADSNSIEGWTIGRVSEKYRNPDNRATLSEQEILARFADTAGAPRFVEQWEKSDTATVYHFYKPIRVSALCLNCHGDLQRLAPGVMQAVRKAYPNDKATGYDTGDLRGMFVVSARWPEGEPFARELVAESL